MSSLRNIFIKSLSIILLILIGYYINSLLQPKISNDEVYTFLENNPEKIEKFIENAEIEQQKNIQ